MNERLSLPARDSEELAAQIYGAGQRRGNTLLTVVNRQTHTNSSVAAIDGRRVQREPHCGPPTFLETGNKLLLSPKLFPEMGMSPIGNPSKLNGNSEHIQKTLFQKGGEKEQSIILGTRRGGF